MNAKVLNKGLTGKRIEWSETAVPVKVVVSSSELVVVPRWCHSEGLNEK